MFIYNHETYHIMDISTQIVGQEKERLIDRFVKSWIAS